MCLGFRVEVKVGLEARGCEIFLGHPKAAVFLIKKLYRNVGSKEDFKDRKMGLKIFIVGIDPECFKTSRNKIWKTPYGHPKIAKFPFWDIFRMVWKFEKSTFYDIPMDTPFMSKYVTVGVGQVGYMDEHNLWWEYENYFFLSDICSYRPLCYSYSILGIISESFLMFVIMPINT